MDNMLENSSLMARVAIVPVPTEDGGLSYHAVFGEKHSRGATAGEALDALTAQLPKGETGLIVIVQGHRPDRFFTAAQQQRLTDLMEHWRDARDRGEPLPPLEQSELNALVEAELRAAAERAAALADLSNG
jgi:hypothetical protein